MKTLTILGSTGSVGRSAIEVIERNKDSFSVHVLTAYGNVSLLAEQARRVGARRAVIGDESLYEQLKDLLSGSGIEPCAGRNAIVEAAGHPVDCTLGAIVGMAGLEPLLAALKNSSHVAIANKEPLVAAGAMVMETARRSACKVLPVDSEHNAIFQVFDGARRDKIRRIILTASGGPFRTWDLESMKSAAPKQALAHPNWSMGAKISIDSATMMNKALEVVEAHYLFDMPAEQIDVLVHPQSIVHSMVEYDDGSVLAQMGASDMKVPITYALAWPERMDGGAQRLDFTKLSALTFEAVDDRRFPAIKAAYDCLKQGQCACIAFNAANEVAVAAYLAGQIGFLDIFRTVLRVVEERSEETLDDLGDILAYDEKMRGHARSCIMNTK